MRELSQRQFAEAQKFLNTGDIMAVPTETVYGLAVSLDNHAAVKRLLDFKQRGTDGDKILTLMLPTVKDIPKYAKVSHWQMALARHHFPGELTIVLPKNDSFKHRYFDHFDSVGVRIPAHDYMLKLLQRTGPLLVTSANRRGQAPCLSATDIKNRLPDIEAVVSGNAGGNLPSTIVDWTGDAPFTVRQGGLLIVHYA